jgi:Na+-transporting methylmalonyl-CoA/oxaloacetate decarboxylase gamma subunit
MFLLKNIDIKLSDGAVFSLVAIGIVFVILITLVLFVTALSKFKFKEEVKKPSAPKKVTVANKKLTLEDIKDEDMMVAALIATAEYVEETKEKDARLVSIKQIG